jgi:cGMP-dependent protein kinase 2
VPPEDLELDSQEANTLVLSEGAVLGGGAFSRVSVVVEDSTGREYALKRMRKSTVVACPDHVYCEQVGRARRLV